MERSGRTIYCILGDNIGHYKRIGFGLPAGKITHVKGFLVYLSWTIGNGDEIIDLPSHTCTR